MSAPNKLGMDLVDGVPCFAVRPRNSSVDRIWEAVEDAINAGMTVEQFKREAAEAWADTLKKHADWAAKDWRKP
jgi:hypothetical protein